MDSAGKDAHVMPEVPAELGVDPLTAALLHMLMFLELSGDGTCDPDWAIEAMESVGAYFQRLPAARARLLVEQVAKIAGFARRERWGDEAITFLDEFAEAFGIEVNEERA